ncbi:MAG: hypothetical protein JNM14_10325 [Ferruginibacter sp.]|nr:hypothetical protein [Ferruginibacter sp.]
MKLKLYTAASLIAIAGLVSCGGNNDKEVVDKSIIPAGSDTTPVQTTVNNIVNPGQTVVPANAPVIPGAAVPNTPVTISQPQTVTMTPQNGTVIPNPQMITQTATAQAATAPGMNPPHGQPGHRCDISVGAPLNSKPAPPATAQPTTVNAQPQVTMKEVPTTTKTAPGMNPPHGEPGHRCDIAVGAPLNSKPAAPTTVTTTSAPASIAPPPLLSAPKSDSTKN